MRAKFKNNLIEQSENKEIEIAITEWQYVKFINNDTKCICGKNLTKYIELVNINNGNIINVGIDCIEYFNQKTIGGFNTIELKSYMKLHKSLFSILDRELINKAYTNNIINDEEKNNYQKYTGGFMREITEQKDWSIRKIVNEKVKCWIEENKYEDTIKEQYTFTFGKHKKKHTKKF